MLRTAFIRLIAILLIASPLAHLLPKIAWAQSLEEIRTRHSKMVQLSNQGRYSEAVKLAEETLGLAEKELGATHPSTLLSVHNLAALYDAQGRYSEAEPLYKLALEGREKMLGTEHPDTLRSANYLANQYQKQGRYSE